ncbi:MAG TPA: VWA domain-containing protein [Verrucomicrobiales bacterium]|nr:VWA domain-containing protein [Verrucomicrobiales bacterium]
MSLSFARPEAFWLLLLLPVFIVLKVLADARARRAVSRLASPRLLDGLLVSEGKGRAWVVFSLELLAFALFAAALAKPQYGTVSEELKSSGRSLIIAMDTSKSMLADDVKPSRLERAQLAAEDLVKKLNKDRIGLLPFARTAFMLTPLTADTEAMLETIQSLDTEIIAQGGSSIAKAIECAIDTFHTSELYGQQAMVIFSDGEELQDEALAAARKARDQKIAIICVAVGTQAGTVIPDPSFPGGIFRDKDNKPVVTRLHKELLMKIADITGGLYLTLEGAGVSDSRIDIILNKLNRSDMKSKTIETNVDRYRWPLAAGLLSLVAAFLTGIVRRHRVAVPGAATAAATAVALFFMAGPPGTLAEETAAPKIADVKQDPKDKEAAPETPEEEPPKAGDPWKFYNEGDWKNSVFNFGLAASRAHTDSEIDRLQMGRGVAAFKAAMADPKKFDSAMMEQSVEAFGIALASNDPAIRESAHYNLANAIFERAKAAEIEREAAFKKAKGKQKKKFAQTLKYLDSVTRQLENSLEHYQQTLVLNGDNKAAMTNMEKVAELVKKIRDIRVEKAKQQQGKAKGKGQKGKGEKSQGQGEGEGEEGEGSGKSKGKGKGKGKGQGQGQGGAGEESEDGEGEEEGDDGEGGDEEGDGSDGEDGEDGDGGEGEAEGDKDGKGGENGEDGKGGKDGEGDGDGANDKSNKEFDGKLKSQGDGGNADGDQSKNRTKEGDGGGSAGEIARNEAIRKLKNLSQELPARGRTNYSVPERRQAKDW